MTAASPLVFPGGRVLAGWWRQLDPLEPRSFWVGHFLLHRVEVLLEMIRRAEVDRFSRLVVQALSAAPNQTVPDLDARLHLGGQVLGQVLRQLQTAGLAEPGAGGSWAPTDLAHQVLQQGEYARTSHERRVFHFLDRHAEPTPAPSAPPLLPLRLPVEQPCPTPEGWSFDLAWFERCLRQSDEWKRERGFPVEARSIVGLETLNGGIVPSQVAATIPAWRRVILDAPQHLFALVAQVVEEGKGEHLLGFGVRQEGWVLEGAQPAFALHRDWRDLFPEVAEDLPLDAWRQAWRTWCQPRGVPSPDVEACVLERQEYRLRVVAPKRLVERLRAARSDALKGEAWLLAGTGNVRGMALVELVEAAG
jgi:hypothetical protein